LGKIFLVSFLAGVKFKIVKRAIKRIIIIPILNFGDNFMLIYYITFWGLDRLLWLNIIVFSNSERSKYLFKNEL